MVEPHVNIHKREYLHGALRDVALDAVCAESLNDDAFSKDGCCLQEEEQHRAPQRSRGASARMASAGMEHAAEPKGYDQLQHLGDRRLPSMCSSSIQLAASLLERKAERLVPPAAPPAREATVQHRRVRRPRIWVHPRLCSCADAVGAQQAGAKERCRGEDGLQGVLDAEHAEEHAVDVQQNGTARNEDWEGRLAGPGP